MSNTFGSCDQRQRRDADDGGDQRHQGAVAAALAAHLACDPFQHFGIDADGLRGRPALDRGFRRQRHGARRHRQAGRGSGVVHDRLGQQIVETAVVAALGGGVVDLEQRFGFGPADRLMLDRGRGQDARAPGGVIGVQLAGKMNTALGGRAFAGDHAIAHDGRAHGRRCCGRKSSRVRGRRSVRRRSARGADIGSYSSQFLVLGQHFHAGVNEWLTIRNSAREIFRWLLICRCDVRHGSGGSQPGPA